MRAKTIPRDKRFVVETRRCDVITPSQIPQSKLFGNPDKAEPKISPDGKRYA